VDNRRCLANIRRPTKPTRMSITRVSTQFSTWRRTYDSYLICIYVRRVNRGKSRLLARVQNTRTCEVYGRETVRVRKIETPLGDRLANPAVLADGTPGKSGPVIFKCQHFSPLGSSLVRRSRLMVPPNRNSRAATNSRWPNAFWKRIRPLFA